jgi:hypothetical protein
VLFLSIPICILIAHHAPSLEAPSQFAAMQVTPTQQKWEMGGYIAAETTLSELYGDIIIQKAREMPDHNVCVGFQFDDVNGNGRMEGEAVVYEPSGKVKSTRYHQDRDFAAVDKECSEMGSVLDDNSEPLKAASEGSQGKAGLNPIWRNRP